MNKTFVSVLWIVFLLTVAAMTGATAAEHEKHHPAEEQGGTAATPQSDDSGQMMTSGMMNMMGQGKGMMTKGMPCMQPSSPSAMMHMMSDALSDRMMMDPAMMKGMMDREFFLNRADELELSNQQVDDLKAIRSGCRMDNIRTGAEAKIAWLDFDELLAEDDWSLDKAEKLIRRIEKLEGDMKLRYLQAIKEAERVLTDDQLEKARMRPKSMQLEELF